HEGGFAVTATLPHDTAHGAAPVEVPDADEETAEPTSARALELARRDVRRSLIQAVAVPLALFGVVLAVSGIVFLYEWNSSELPGPVYDGLRIGQSRAEVAPRLPERQRIARPVR